MTVQGTINLARQHLHGGNAYGYAAIISGCIRSSLGKAAIQKLRNAVASDDMQHAFIDWETSVPLPKPGAI